MKYRDLKAFINSLNEQQLEQPVRVFPSVNNSFEVESAHINPEDLFYDIWDPEHGCEKMENIENFNDGDYEIGIPAGTIMLTEYLITN